MMLDKISAPTYDILGVLISAPAYNILGVLCFW